MMILSVCAFVFSVLAFVAAIYAVIQVEAFKRSTHQVMMYDAGSQKFTNLVKDPTQGESSFEPMSDQLKEKLRKTPFDNVN